MRFFVGGSFLFQLSSLVSDTHGCRLIFGLPRTYLAVSRIAVPIALTRLLIFGSKKLSAANRPPIVALKCIAMFGYCRFSMSNLIRGFLFFRFFCNLRIIVIITRSWSLPTSAPGEVLVFSLLKLDLNH